jgi:hypothetical protein
MGKIKKIEGLKSIESFISGHPASPLLLFHFHILRQFGIALLNDFSLLSTHLASHLLHQMPVLLQSNLIDEDLVADQVADFKSECLELL